MEKIQIDDCICHSKIKEHLKIKDSILSEISNNIDEKLEIKDGYYIDSISKLDWYNCRDFTRKWVNIFMPLFTDELIKIMKSMAYNQIELYQVWYQQYLEGDRHGWHIHGNHYTGVYYLEFPKGCSKTEVCSPFNFNKKQIDVQEGDMIVFPAHFIHRGMPNLKSRKTIISFNFDVIASQVDQTDRPCLNLKLIEN